MITDYEFARQLITNNGSNIKYVDEKILDDNLCCLAVRDNSIYLEFVPEHLQTYCLINIALNVNTDGFKFIKNIDYIKDYINNNNNVHQIFKYISDEYKTPEVCKKVVLNKPSNIEYVPYDKQTSDIATFAILSHPSLIKYIDPKYITNELSKIVFESNKTQMFAKDVLNYLSSDFRKEYLEKNPNNWNEISNITEDELIICINKIPEIFKHLNNKLKTEKVCLFACEKTENALSSTPHDIKTLKIYQTFLKHFPHKVKTIRDNILILMNNGLELKDLSDIVERDCRIAVEEDGMALKYVPNEFKTYKICRLAVMENGYAIEFVPSEHRTNELYKISLKQEGMALEYVYDEHKNDELYKIAVKQTGYAIQYVLDHDKNKHICLMAIQNCPQTLSYVKYHDIELYEYAVKLDGLALSCIPKEYKTVELCKIAITQNVHAIKYV